MNQFYTSPIGILNITSSDQHIIRIEFVDHVSHSEPDEVTNLCASQLQEYFAGTRYTFSIPLSLHGTEFQQHMWQTLQTIPYGNTYTYKQIAILLGKPKGARAVGTANAVNRIAIVIPCHRLIGSNGMLRGYYGGLNRKQWLLDHEKQHMSATLPY